MAPIFFVLSVFFVFFFIFSLFVTTVRIRHRDQYGSLHTRCLMGYKAEWSFAAFGGVGVVITSWKGLGYE